MARSRDDEDGDRPRRKADRGGRGRGPAKRGIAPGAILLGAGVLAVVLLGVVVVVRLLTHPGSPRTADFDIDAAVPIKITAAQLAAEYQADPRKADAAYKGKVLEVSGPLNGSSGSTEFLFVTLDGGALQVVCTVDVRRQTTPPDGLGRTTTVRGRCQGLGKDGVSLDLCRSVAAAVKSIPMDATALAGEYATNAAAADGRYKGREVDVTGVVAKVQYDPPNLDVTVTLEGAGGTPVECRLMPYMKQAAGRPRFGRTLTVRGDCAGLAGGTLVIENATVVK